MSHKFGEINQDKGEAAKNAGKLLGSGRKSLRSKINGWKAGGNC
jgi:hypothetical protein